MKANAEIFLSYAREDEEAVESLYQRLSRAGFKPWMAKKEILPGQEWEPTIEKAIRRSDFFLPCLSAKSVRKRGFLQREIKKALDVWLEKLESDIYLIPVRLEDCEVPESLRKFHWVDLFEEGGWTRLVKAIQEGMERLAQTTRPTVRESTSFDVYPASERPSLSPVMPTSEQDPERSRPMIAGDEELSALLETVLPLWDLAGEAEDVSKILLFVLRAIIRDRHTDGDSKGGWGRAYQERFLPLLYPDKLPTAISVTPDSITFTALVLQGLACLTGSLDKSIVDFPWLQAFLADAKGYLDLHHDPQTGGSGPVIRGTAGDLVRHVTLRHTAAGAEASLLVPGCLEQALRGVRWLLRQCRETTLRTEMTATLAHVYRLLETVLDSKRLLDGIGGHDVVAPSKMAVVAALLDKYDSGKRCWVDGEGDHRLWLFRLVYGLKCTTGLSRSPDADVRRMFADGVEQAIDSLRFLEPTVCGMPFFYGEEPDVGMTASFLYVLGQTRLDGSHNELIKPCAQFIRKYYGDDRYLKRSFSWTLSTILLCAKNNLL